MTAPLTRFNLDFVRCMAINCTTPHPHPLHMRPVCHPHAYLDVEYYAGVLTFRCSRCLDMVAQVAVEAGAR